MKGLRNFPAEGVGFMFVGLINALHRRKELFLVEAKGPVGESLKKILKL